MALPEAAALGSEVIDLREPRSGHQGDAATVPEVDGVRVVSAYERRVKRVLDVVLAIVVLVLVSWILAAVALLIRIKLGRGVLFRQERVGQHGRTFEIYKFRTMHHDRRQRAEPRPDGVERRQSHKRNDDPRHTPFGRRLRKWSLDELPQLVNVIRGDMSLVGPRPELVEIVSRYEHWQHGRHAVRPGLTGLWQVTKRGEGLPSHLATHVDLEYVESISWRGDVVLMLCTPLALLRQPGR